MSNFYSDNADLRFYVDEFIDWEPLTRLTEYNYKAEGGFTNAEEALDFYRDVIDLVGEFASRRLAPLSEDLDREHPKISKGKVTPPPAFEKVFKEIKEMELHGMCLPRELGGMNCPFIVFNLACEIISRADVAVSTHFGFHGGIAMAMLLYSITEGTTQFDRSNNRITSTRFNDAIKEIASGEAWGSMDITEPGAGSDMAALRTRAEQDDDGEWRVTGQKIFITSGHGKYHFVIARTEKKKPDDDEFAGLKGLSMFLVPAWTEDEDGNKVMQASFDSLEEKLGHHCSATVAVGFDETPAMLIGKRGDGFKLMLQLMNNARVSVGFEAIGLCETAVRMASEYAAERESMGKTINRHEMIADYLDEMRTDIQGMRALAVLGSWHEEMAQKLQLSLEFFPPDDERERKKAVAEQKRHRDTSRRYTPLLKYIAAERAVEIARKCIQIHGGYGYSAEYGAEKLLRDAMVLPIYEGTSQIQALMAMKDSLVGIMKDPVTFARQAAGAALKSRTATDRYERRVSGLAVLANKSLQLLIARIVGGKFSDIRKKAISDWSDILKDWDPKRDFAPAMLHAERLTVILADVAVSEILLDQSRACPERKEVLDRYLERAETRCRFMYDEIKNTGALLLESLKEVPDDS